MIYAMTQPAVFELARELSESMGKSVISVSSTGAGVARERVKKASISECGVEKVVDARGR